MHEDFTQPRMPQSQGGAVRIHDDMPDFAGVSGRAAHHLIIEYDSAADAGAHVHEDEAAGAARAAGPGFGDGGAGDVLVHEGGQAGGRGQGVAERDAVPAGQQRRVHHGAFLKVDRARRGDAQAGDPGRVHAGVLR